jgi:heparan-alpha-glucosaminide N-acetyltransferase
MSLTKALDIEKPRKAEIHSALQSAPTRIASIDILRAVTMVLMIFVNDLWSLKNIPGWLDHVPSGVDGMGLADVIFPAFLFIVGMSIPFAIEARRKKGDNNFQLTGHTLSRTLALLVMGLFLVNGENINPTATGMQRVVWYSISCLSFILIWNTYSLKTQPVITRALKAVGIGVLILLAIVY